jgi:hypothetical protein
VYLRKDIFLCTKSQWMTRFTLTAVFEWQNANSKKCVSVVHKILPSQFSYTSVQLFLSCYLHTYGWSYRNVNV